MDGANHGLTLTRRLYEQIVVTIPSGEALTITVVEAGARGAQVKLAFSGDRSTFQVHRKEVQERIDRGDTRPPRTM